MSQKDGKEWLKKRSKEEQFVKVNLEGEDQLELAVMNLQQNELEEVLKEVIQKMAVPLIPYHPGINKIDGERQMRADLDEMLDYIGHIVVFQIR